MKKVLITGKNSYIGNSLEKWLLKEPDQYQVDKISLRDDAWKEKDFSKYDSIVHVAGIAHNSTKKSMKDLYYKVNRDLTIEVAKKAKNDKVKQFIFMSSIIVYGSKHEVITKDTIPEPDNFYGKSKLQAEKDIQKLESEDFKVAIIRPPMVYGKGSKGNYPKLAKLARITPIFPDIDNKRSMLYIGNLCEFIKIIVDDINKGIYHPQNQEYVSTSLLVEEIAKVNSKNIKLTKLFNTLIMPFRKNNVINKIFGNIIVHKDLSDYKDKYIVIGFKDSISITEGQSNQ